eukprot:s27_g57.t2
MAPLLTEKAELKLFGWSDVVDWNMAIKASGKRWTLGLVLLEAMLHRILQPDIISHSTSIPWLSWTAAIAALRRIGHVALRPNVVTFGGAINGCQKAAQWQSAVALLLEAAMIGSLPNVVMLNSCISATGDWQIAMQLLSTMQMWRVTADVVTVNSLIAVCEQCCQWQAALALLYSGLQLESQLLPNLISFNSTISACSKQSESSRVTALISIMKEQRVQADVVSYNSIISGHLGHFSAWQSTVQVLDELKIATLRASSVTFNTAMSAAGSTWEVVLGLLIATPFTNVVTCTSAIDGCSDRWEMAMHFLGRMLWMGLLPNVITLSSVLSACQTAQRWHIALAVQQMSSTSSVLPNVICYNSSCTSCEQSGRWWMTLDLLRQMSLKRVTASSLSHNSAIAACEQALKWDLTLVLLEGLEQSGLGADALSYSSAVCACQGPAVAVALLSRLDLAPWTPARKVVTLPKRRSSSPRCSCLLLEQTAVKIVGKRKDQQMVTMESVTSLVRASSRAKRPWQESEELLSKAQHSVASLPGADLRLLNCVVEACAKANAVNRCIFWLDEMKSRTLAPNVISFTSALSGCKGPGSRVHAQEICRRLQASGVKPDDRLTQAVQQVFGVDSVDGSGSAKKEKEPLLVAAVPSVTKPKMSSYNDVVRAASGGIYKCIHGPRVAIRAAPSATAAVLDTIHPGTLIRIAEVAAGWARVDDDELILEQTRLVVPEKAFILVDGSQVGLKTQLLERLSEDAELEAQWPFREAMELRCLEVNQAAQRKEPGAAQALRRRFVDAAMRYVTELKGEMYKPGSRLKDAPLFLDHMQLIQKVVEDLKQDGRDTGNIYRDIQNHMFLQTDSLTFDADCSDHGNPCQQTSLVKFLGHIQTDIQEYALYSDPKEAQSGQLKLQDFGFLLIANCKPVHCRKTLPVSFEDPEDCEAGDLIFYEELELDGSPSGRFPHVEIFIGGDSGTESLGSMPWNAHSRTKEMDGVQVFEDFRSFPTANVAGLVSMTESSPVIPCVAPKMCRALLASTTLVLMCVALGWLGHNRILVQPNERRLGEGRPRCTMSGRSCQQTHCCAQMHDRCFQQFGESSFCRPSCSPRKGWSCHEPFAHPLAKARHTEEWPDVVAVCSAGMVLVEREAFQQKYNATCDQYCEKGAGPSVRTLMFGLQGRGNGAYQSCPGDKPGKDQGALCECSFPDRTYTLSYGPLAIATELCVEVTEDLRLLAQ